MILKDDQNQKRKFQTSMDKPKASAGAWRDNNKGPAEKKNI